MAERLLFDGTRLSLTLERLAWQVIENRLGTQNLCLIGLQPRGVYLARRIHNLLQELLPDAQIPYGELDATFYRDDFRRGKGPLVPNATRIDFLLENRTVLLVDDVLYTGRTIRAALDALLAFGRPEAVQLLVLIDRRWKRELPIQATYVGLEVDTPSDERVLVSWSETGAPDGVRIVAHPTPTPPAT
ncbi:MAG: bifunctional pyr operon transcriptional regulator/uracil phosphoribosyltransferase PyrR [Bacteroidia bacterium]|nr:bifunctional pyr operon transcriptional regulator/uracil phosphoribosyltransferase PyrR [Bacteroidia bacterium]